MEEIKQGYKQTDIGVIPEDWDVSSLGDISIYQGGSQPDISFFSARQYNGFIRLIQIRDYKTDKYAVYIPENLARRKCTKDDIMIGRYGPPIFQILKGLEGAYNVALIKAIPADKIDKSFFYYTLRREDLFQLIELLSRRSSGQTGVDLVGLKAFKIGLPPTNEQTAIATALSDTDALIAALDKKIAKKQQIKQGAMQQLLTGKKRLPGFSGKWVEKTLGSLIEITSSKRVFQSEWKSSGIPFYRARELAVLGEIGSVNNELFISKEMYENFKISYGVPKKGDILVTGVGTLGKTYIVEDGKEFYFKDGNIIWFKINEEVNSFFLKQLYLTPLIIKQIEDGSAGTTVGTYTISNAKKTIAYFPDINEQTAIAQILTDMDNEIAQLEKERDKYKEIKAGMMQVLLTGKIRLIK